MSDGTWSYKGPECPYCDHQHIADDPFYYDESNYTSQKCDGCGKTFNVAVCQTVAWACEQPEIED